MAPWETDYAKALEASRKSGKSVFVYFESLGGGLPKRIAKALEAPRFLEWAKGHVLLYHLSCGLPDESHPRLQQEKGGGWLYVHMAILDAEGHVLAKGTWLDDAEDCFDEQAAQAALDAGRNKEGTLRGLAEKGDRTASLELLEHDVALWNLGPQGLEKRLAALGRLDAGEAAAAAGLRAGAEYVEACQRADSPQDLRRLCVEMFRGGKLPCSTLRFAFLSEVLEGAHQERDAIVLEQALGRFREWHGMDPRFAWGIGQWQERLEKLKSRRP